MKILTILILTFIFSFNLLYSQIDTFLSWGVSAKTMGMARAHTSLAEDGSSIFYNPSLLSKIKLFEFLGNYTIFYEDSMYGYLSFVSPTPYGSAGIAIQNLSIPNILLRDTLAKPIGTADGRITSIYFSYGSNLNEIFLSSEFITLYLGASAKFISQKLYNLEAGGMGFDIGSQINLDFGFYKLLFGFNFVNIFGTSIKLYTEEKIPFIFRMGVGLLIFDESLKFTVDTVQSKNIKDINFGVEYILWKLFSLRSGINDKEFTLGLGITRQNIQFNYAFVLNRGWRGINLGMLHTFDFIIRWSLRKK